MSDTVLSNFTPGVEAKSIDTSRILKVGIIGTGSVSYTHLDVYKRQASARAMPMR